MRRRVLPLLALAVAAGCSSAPPKPADISISGTLSVHGGQSWNNIEGEECSMFEAGYSDIRQGAQVVVTDATGKTLALGTLGAGKRHLPEGAAPVARRCAFPFTVQAPGGQDFYGIEVSHRGRLQYTAEQVREPLELTLGD
ncbi:hypothetical protein ACQP1V_36125 [Microtetraspora malaysiensis]|uniref:hypothetical protein n=1 Tax=Microtetraspora malaysiensis TaxID=161358 RepID=UPI003D94F485